MHYWQLRLFERLDWRELRGADLPKRWYAVPFQSSLLRVWLHLTYTETPCNMLTRKLPWPWPVCCSGYVRLRWWLVWFELRGLVLQSAHRLLFMLARRRVWLV